MGSQGGAAHYLIYRDSASTGVRDLVGLALADYQKRHAGAPAGLVVPKGLIGEARDVVRALAIAGLPVSGCGGCLVGEVWLAVDGGEGESAS